MHAATREHSRVRAHLEGALALVSSTVPRDLSPSARAKRATLLEALRAYIDAGHYPLNELARDPTPIFVDRGGRRCAVAALLEATGHHGLVARIARRQNLARVVELAADPALAAWLDEHGLRVEEAARIQPAYHAHLEAEWQPTASVVAGAHGGASATVGAEAMVAAGARAGARRSVHGSDDRGSSQFGSTACVVEYARAAVPGRGAAHQIGLVLQWEPISNHRDVQWYVVGGPLAAIDGDARPGRGLGGQLGVGASLRKRAVPIFAELVVQSLPVADFVTVRGGVQLGVVY